MPANPEPIRPSVKIDRTIEGRGDLLLALDEIAHIRRRDAKSSHRYKAFHAALKRIYAERTREARAAFPPSGTDIAFTTRDGIHCEGRIVEVYTLQYGGAAAYVVGYDDDGNRHTRCLSLPQIQQLN